MTTTKEDAFAPSGLALELFRVYAKKVEPNRPLFYWDNDTNLLRAWDGLLAEQRDAWEAVAACATQLGMVH